jgi:hypothetical protein
LSPPASNTGAGGRAGAGAPVQAQPVQAHQG